MGASVLDEDEVDAIGCIVHAPDLAEIVVWVSWSKRIGSTWSRASSRTFRSAIGFWPVNLNSPGLEVLRFDRFGLDDIGLNRFGLIPGKDGICVDPPLCRGTSQGKYGSCTKDLVCVGETVGKKSEMGERELVLVVSVRCGKE